MVGHVLHVLLVSVLPRARKPSLSKNFDNRWIVGLSWWNFSSQWILNTIWTLGQYPLTFLQTTEELCYCLNPLFNGENWKERRTTWFFTVKIFSFSFKYNWGQAEVFSLSYFTLGSTIWHIYMGWGVQRFVDCFLKLFEFFFSPQPQVLFKWNSMWIDLSSTGNPGDHNFVASVGQMCKLYRKCPPLCCWKNVCGCALPGR